VGTGGLPATFENPGLPPHVHRAADDDPKAAKRAERQVAALFTLSILGTLGFIVSYFAIDRTTSVFLPFIGLTNLLNVMLGVCLGIALLGIGFGAVHWAKTLMSDEEVVEERHAIGTACWRPRPRPPSCSCASIRPSSRTTSWAEGPRLGLHRASSPTPRSAPTSGARSACTSSRPTTCSARATSRPSTSPDDCEVIFGPAKRPLPQLKITVDDEGYLVAASRSPSLSARASGSVADDHCLRAHRADDLRADDAGPQRAESKAGGVAGWVDERTGLAKGVGYLMKKVFPDHWSFMLGEIAMYSMIICLLTGVFLSFWFVPSAGHIPYDGSYVPLQGVTCPRRTPRRWHLVRHPWRPADPPDPPLGRPDVHRAAITVHMLRVFFTGAFRKPRELNWVIGSILSMLAIVEGFAGYSLPTTCSRAPVSAPQGFIRRPVVGSYLVLPALRRHLPRRGDHPAALQRARPAAAGRAHRPVHRAHRPGRRAQAHPVPRPRPHQRERRRLPADAGLRRQGRWLLLHRVRRHLADLGLGHDQPGLGLRSVRPLPRDGRLAAGLVHGLRRRRPAPPAGWLEFESFGFTWSMNVFLGAVASCSR
jgi:hypothetical protein